MQSSRIQALEAVCEGQPAFRKQQLAEAMWHFEYAGFQDASNVPKGLREKAVAEVPWMTVKEKLLLRSKTGDTYKAALELSDGLVIEAVLMSNARDQWSLCVSSQVGCAMACTFCATGKMGFTRNLTADEIIDQYRFWGFWLAKHPELPQRISNVVFMGMGEPLVNYDNVKTTIHTWLKHTDLGRTHITVSTVGVLPLLDRLLEDPSWPHTRVAVSLHSADLKTRKNIVPTSHPEFLSKLAEWAKRYQAKWGNRRHYLTFEHVMLDGVNDTEEHARQLANFSNKVGDVHVNLIPWNAVGNTPFAATSRKTLDTFTRILEQRGVSVTVRRNMGMDIAAACGQLANQPKK